MFRPWFDPGELEEWRPVPGHPLLLASSLGRVRSVRYRVWSRIGTNAGWRECEMAPTWGHLYWDASGKPRSQAKFCKKSYKVHQLVCLAFHGPKPFPAAVAMHVDETSVNNRPENLRWGTQKENLSAPGYMAWKRAQTGENNAAAKSRRKRALLLRRLGLLDD